MIKRCYSVSPIASHSCNFEAVISAATSQGHTDLAIWYINSRLDDSKFKHVDIKHVHDNLLVLKLLHKNELLTCNYPYAPVCLEQLATVHWMDKKKLLVDITYITQLPKNVECLEYLFVHGKIKLSDDHMRRLGEKYIRKKNLPAFRVWAAYGGIITETMVLGMVQFRVVRFLRLVRIVNPHLITEQIADYPRIMKYKRVLSYIREVLANPLAKEEC
jgi:hypothetical protein